MITYRLLGDDVLRRGIAQLGTHRLLGLGWHVDGSGALRHLGW